MGRFPRVSLPHVACQSYTLGQIKSVLFWRANQPKRTTRYLQFRVLNAHPDQPTVKYISWQAPATQLASPLKYE